ncbi:hypothetical protein DPMN_050023 [Dreissena polymorpha]|uniref:Uncharacterized protein n=1 Tax=Dreissena polymorpha TaxID=45954 RepID=A0A9D4HLV3_DREPO|nr:hypothetical protein DPMN_050023 [Dreissena polymorpha]
MKKSAIQIAEDDAVDVDEPEVATSVAPPVKLRCADDSGENGAVIDCGYIFRKTDGLSQGNDVGEQEASQKRAILICQKRIANQTFKVKVLIVFAVIHVVPEYEGQFVDPKGEA